MGVLFVLAIFRNPLNQRKSFTKLANHMLPVTDAAATSKRRNMLTDDHELCGFFLLTILYFSLKL